jgi:two-component system phosphate regulon sensor histidine kinase PhoR
MAAVHQEKPRAYKINMAVKSKTLRWIIVMGSALVAVIITIQLFWLQKIYNYEQKLFNTNVLKSTKALYKSMPLIKDSVFKIEDLIENPQTDIYLARLDVLPDINKVTASLSEDFTDFDIFADCKIALYDANRKMYVAEKFIDIPNVVFKSKKHIKVPFINKEYSYLALYFPNRNLYILKQMYFWILSGAILILALIGMALAIFFLYRQRFLNEIQKDFVNNFTHEFKTPLAVLKIAAGVLQQPNIIERPDKLKNYAGILKEQIDYLQEQTQRLLQVAYTEQSELPLKKEKFNLENLFEKAMANVAPLLEEKNGTIVIKDKNKESMIWADKSYLLLSFVNIIENALKYASYPEIEISINKEGDFFLIGIKDNGPGIEKRHQKKIFDKFYRITAGDLQASKGFGLGLNFVKKVMDAHKASIKVISDFGKGSLFLIKIPME